jgi:mannose-6-phosphate isomerase-like protein (cupin superfamily)
MRGPSHYAIHPDNRTLLLQGPLGAVLLLGAERTGGQLSVVEHPLAPRALGSPVHTHRHEDEYSVVLEGVVGAQVGDETLQAEPGTVLVKPRGVPHAFWNPADRPARLLEIIAPGGFEHYFADMADIFAAPGAPDPARLAAAAGRYGLDVDFSSITQLAAAHGLDIPPPAPG